MTARESGRANAQFAFSFPLKVLATVSGLLMLALVVGWLLPGRWQVERDALVDASPAVVFGWLEDARRWGDWAPLGDVEASFSGPERGPGATRSWDHPELGDGVFTIVATDPDREVRYRVRVERGSLVTEGTFRLEPEGEGTRVTWQESGDFGRNPLFGFLAPSMDRMQGAQMEGALARLARRVAEG